MIDVEQMYYSDSFQAFLDKLTFKSSIRDRDDYKHDVFAEMIASDAQTVRDCKRAAWRIADDYMRDLKNDRELVDRSVIV